MKLIAGLGNPGKKYEKTRHNTGALMLREFLISNSPPFPKFKFNKKFKSLISKGELNDEEIILALPQTFMNNSGEAIKALASYYRLDPADIWIVHDDIDLPLGKIRISYSSRAGGHKGVQSIIEKLKTKDFVRFRIGIAISTRKMMPTDKFVLQNFTKEEKEKVDEVFRKTSEAIKVTLKNGVEKAMNKFN